MAYTLKDYYSRIRRNGTSATKALTLARSNYEAKRNIWDIPAKRSIEYNAASNDGLRWVEHASDGLRFVNYCDKISQCINHTGWFTDSDGINDTLRGVVYLLPHGRYVAGYAESCNFNETGGERLDFSTIYKTDLEAARASDRLAEFAAEKERKYNDAWLAGSRYSDNQEQIASIRKDCLALIAAIKKERARGAADPICTVLRDKVKNYCQSIANLRKTCQALINENNNTWQRHTWGAFNEGAGATIIKT